MIKIKCPIGAQSTELICSYSLFFSGGNKNFIIILTSTRIYSVLRVLVLPVHASEKADTFTVASQIKSKSLKSAAPSILFPRKAKGKMCSGHGTSCNTGN